MQLLFFHFVHSQTQNELYITQWILRAHTLWIETGLEPWVISTASFSESVILSARKSTFCRSRFREEPEILGEAQCFPIVEPLDAALQKDLRGLGKAASVRWNGRRIPRLSLQFSKPREALSVLSHTRWWTNAKQNEIRSPWQP